MSKSILIMSFLDLNGIQTYYEIKGQGIPLIFVHGGFVNSSMWKPQIEYFSKYYQVITYDIRGHGKTGITNEKNYSIELFADDLSALIKQLQLEKPIICGLSLGGMIAQSFAVKYPDELSALILSDTAVSTALTFWDKVMVYILYPKWLMLLFLRLFGVKNFIKFSFSIAKLSRGKKWLGNEEIIDYEKNEMLKLDKKEYLKIFGAIYDFRKQLLSKIKVNTLILAGENESKSVLKHTRHLHELISQSQMRIIPSAGHMTNLENPEEFNSAKKDFLNKLK
ncbi:MAG: alpha/beta fold hydrolase [Candidatus Thorarchaeota archaeon]